MWIFIFAFLLILVAWCHIRKCLSSVIILVLGDIGRSPRMMYHALSLAKDTSLQQIILIGYAGSPVMSELSSNSKVKFMFIRETPRSFNSLPFVFGFIFKVMFQVIVLCFYLLRCGKAKFLLLQNPPAVPTLAVCSLFRFLHGTKFIIDWHNYAYTILQLKLPKQHFLCILSRWFEKLFCRFAQCSICVSEEMQKDLLRNWDVRATVHYDRPAGQFSRLDVQAQHRLFARISPILLHNSSFVTPEGMTFLPQVGGDDETMFTRVVDGRMEVKENRPALLVSSTSWTEDEDFGIFFEALCKYDAACGVAADLPLLFCVITGKGPLKRFYQRKMENVKLRHVQVAMPWLEIDDYPRMLGSADLGICLHTSSSGLDLPMKVVDMFGCELPVLAFHYKTLHELVQHDVNGLHFRDSGELAEQIMSLLKGFPDSSEHLDRYRKNVRKFKNVGWKDSWIKTVKPIFE